MSLDTKPQRPKRATTLLFALAPLITPTLFTPAMAQAPSTTELQTSNPADPVIEAYTPPKPKHIDIPQFPHDAYTGIVQYMYARQWGTPSQQLDALNRAIAEEPRAHYLPNELFRGALLDSFRLQANLHMYSEAMTTWDRLQHTGLDKGTAMKLKEVIARLDAIRKDDSAYTVQGAIEDGRWHLHLFKRHFQVRVNDGQVTDVKLRCDKHHYMFAFDPSLQYTLNSHAGDCSIELLGAPGTRFDFIQF